MMLSADEDVIFEFHGFRLDPLRRMLLGPDSTAITLKPKVFDTLVFLVTHRGELLSKQMLLDAIWGRAVVDENSLNQNISILRRTFGEAPGDNGFIVTVRGIGYRFVADVRTKDSQSARKMELAVLPFECLTPGQDFFADGMTDELITRLAQLSGLRVVSRTSIMTYRESKKLLPMIANELRVEVIVEGSIQRFADRVRITVQVIDAVDDRHIWAETYDRDCADVLIVQAAIARSIAQRISVQITSAEQSRFDRASTVDPRVYDACLKGLEHYYRMSQSDLDQALEYFHFALSLDPSCSKAHAGIAAVWIGRQQMSFVPNRVATPRASESALRALELDESLAEAWFVLSEVKSMGEFDFVTAEAHMLKALDLNPSFAEARAVYSHQLCCLGRHAEALSQIELALKLDPLNTFFKAFYGVTLYFSRRFDDAIELLRSALEENPGLPFALQVITSCYHLTGRFDEAVETQKDMMAVLGDDEALMAITDGINAGGYTDAMRRLAGVTAARSLAADNVGVYVALRYGYAGEVDGVLQWLEKAVEQRDPNVPYIPSPIPDMLEFESHPRYKQLMERLLAETMIVSS